MKIEQLENIIYSKLENDEQQISLSLNDPKTCYETVKDLVKDRPNAKWISAEEKAESINTNTVWCISFYDSNENSDANSLYGVSLKTLMAQYFGLDINSLNAVDELENKLKGLLDKNGILHVTYSRKLDDYDNISLDWTSEEDNKNAVDNKSICELHVYPRTPIGFYVVMSDSLDKAVDWTLSN